MSFFTIMYAAALKMDREEMKNILNKGACIDEREISKEFNTVAGKLARAGKIAEAKWLINRFGAGIEFVIVGLREGGYQEEAKELADKYGLPVDVSITKSDIYESALIAEFVDSYCLYRAKLIAGDVKGAEEITSEHPRKPGYYDMAETFLAYGGHIFYLENFHYKKNILKELPHDFFARLVNEVSIKTLGIPSYRFKTTALMLHTLSFIDDMDSIKPIKIALENEIDKPLMLDVLIKQAKQIHYLMDAYQFDYEQALLCSNQSDKTIETVKGPVFVKSQFANTVKSQQLINVYGFNEKQANEWRSNARLRMWSRCLYFNNRSSEKVKNKKIKTTEIALLFDLYNFLPLDVFLLVYKFVTDLNEKDARDLFTKTYGVNKIKKLIEVEPYQKDSFESRKSCVIS